MLTNWFDSHSGDPNPILPIGQGSEAEQLVAAYANSPSIGFCVLDSQLRYLSINATLARINGLPAKAHLGRSLTEIVGEIAGQIEPWVHKVLSEGEPILNVTISGRRPNQSETGQWIDHFHPIKDESGKVIRVGILVVEKTDEKKLWNAFHELGNELRGETERLQMLHDVNALISSNWDLPQVFPRISARIRHLLHHEYASLSLHEPATGLLVRHAIDFPLSKGFTSNVQIRADDSPSGLVLRERKPRIFSRDELQRFEGETTDRFLAEGLESLCCVPLNRPSGTLGVLVLGSTRQKAFADKDASLLEIVAAQMAIAIENRNATEELNALKKRLAEERNYLAGEIASQALFSEIIGQSPALKLVLEQVATVATSHATVLILGETGTGKELIARAIHRMSRVQDGPFIKLNCAAIPTGLLESELFGHEKGAFTGAVSQKVGRMELADGGTLFLDEVGEIPLELQPKLLRVLQDQEFERLGSNRTISVKVRVLAATNRDLADDVAKHKFRSDLFYRLNVFPILMPALRERREDIPLLVRYFVRKFSNRMGRNVESVPTETMDTLTNWDWPGNIRELENLMERSVILSPGKTLRVPIAELRAAAPLATFVNSAHTLDAAEREHIIRILRETRGVLSGANGAAQRLGLKRTTLQSKIKRLQISRSEYEGPNG